MKENFYEISPVVEMVMLNEAPGSVLEISGYKGKYGRMISDCQNRAQTGKDRNLKLIVDRIDLTDANSDDEFGIYNRVFKSETLSSLNDLEEYDVIIIFHLYENMHNEDAKDLLEALLKKTKNQILIITPEYPYDLTTEGEISDVRTYYPEFFSGIKHSHTMLNTSEGVWQAYCFFP